jgi:hypothetical protein
MTVAKRGRRAKTETSMGARKKTSIVIPDGLLQGLKHAAVEERTDVSSLLCRLAEDYLKARKWSR